MDPAIIAVKKTVTDKVHANRVIHFVCKSREGPTSLKAEYHPIFV